MIPKAFKACFKVIKMIMSLSLGKREDPPFLQCLFCCTCNLFVQQQNQYCKMTVIQQTSLSTNNVGTRLVKKENTRRQTKRRMLAIKNIPLLAITIHQATKTTIPSSVTGKNIIVDHAKAMDMICCCSPAYFIIGIIQMIASLWVLPPIALETKLLKTVMVAMTDESTFTHDQEAFLVIIMITGIANASQLLVIADTKIT